MNQVTVKLRLAVNTDFADQFGNKRLGVAYFCKNHAGDLESRINYFTEITDMLTFKLLYSKKQIFVIANPFDIDIKKQHHDPTIPNHNAQ